MLKLNISCGRDVRKGWVNVDCEAHLGVMVMDASKPFPFPDDYFDEILASQVFEHIDTSPEARYPKWTFTMKECIRVLKPGGILNIGVPYGVNPDPFHVTYFWPHTMDWYINDNPGLNSLQLPNKGMKSFDLLSMRITRWSPIPFKYHLKKYLRLSKDRWIKPISFKYRTLDEPFFLKIGKPYEIFWELRKTGTSKAHVEIRHATESKLESRMVRHPRTVKPLQK